PDIAMEVDLIEEIARIEGYDKIPTADRNLGSLFTPEHSDDLFRQSAKETITAQGFDEIYGSGLADPRLLSKIIGEKKQLKILNPIAEDLSVMQGTLLYSLLRAISHNLSRRNLDMRLFEIGKSFIPPNDISGELRNLQEVEEIGIILSGKSDDEWYGRGRPHDFYELKGVIDNLLEANRISAIKYISTGLSAFADGYAFQLMLNNAMIGYAGEVLPSIARAFDIKQPVFAAILNFEELIKNQQPEKLYESLPRFPAAPRDLSIIVDESIKVGDILEAIRKTGGSLLEKVKLFDLYKGSQIGERKKSLAFSITYRSSERSLEGGEVIELHNKISDCLVKRFKAEVREG
ncbi:MAG: hypothetical protein NTV06_03585, partial [candidate division Zixibacteria bacterium]|nr:hypothetical protein [candidate division Zixibacteria bacterium]